jgi:alkanesulfonate monooxygenase
MGATAIAHPRLASEELRLATGAPASALASSRDRGDRMTIARRDSPKTAGADGQANPYWLAPFLNGRSTCPYLVGSYDAIAHELRHYIARGCQTFLLDVPPDPEELEHVNIVFTRAQLAVAV